MLMFHKIFHGYFQNGPPQYRCSTIFEDVIPAMVREFFWDDEFRLKWDDMLVNAEILQECPSTGAMVVQWALKVGRDFCCIFSCLVHLGLVGVYGLMFFFFVPHSFPSFVEIIGQQIWESERYITVSQTYDFKLKNCPCTLGEYSVYF